MTNEQEKQWREEFERWVEREYVRLSLSFRQMLFTCWNDAKQSSQAIIDAKDMELEAEREKVMILRDASKQALYLLRNGKSGWGEAKDILSEALADTAPAEPKEE